MQSFPLEWFGFVFYKENSSFFTFFDENWKALGREVATLAETEKMCYTK